MKDYLYSFNFYVENESVLKNNVSIISNKKESIVLDKLNVLFSTIPDCQDNKLLLKKKYIGETK